MQRKHIQVFGTVQGVDLDFTRNVLLINLILKVQSKMLRTM